MPKERFHEKLMEVLKTHPDFIDDEKGELLRAAVIDRAWQLDHSLIRLLLKDDACTALGFLDHSLKQDCATRQSH